MDKNLDVSNVNIRIGYWTYVENKFTSENERKKIYDDITGKYLFFSKDSDVLLKIALNELNNGFDVAKFNTKKEKKDHVLCIYYKDDSRKQEFVGKYKDVAYRYWKSDEDTRNGVYSQQFLDSQKTSAPAE